MKKILLPIVLLLISLNAFGQSDATFEETIDFINRHVLKSYHFVVYNSYWEIVVSDAEKMEVIISTESDFSKKWITTFSFKDIDETDITVFKYNENLWVVGIACKRNGCVKFRNSESVFFDQMSGLNFMAKDEETALRIIKALKHACSLAPKEKF